jgi:hypothetical protein
VKASLLLLFETHPNEEERCETRDNGGKDPCVGQVGDPWGLDDRDQKHRVKKLADQGRLTVSTKEYASNKGHGDPIEDKANESEIDIGDKNPASVIQFLG